MNERIKELYLQANTQARQNACAKNNTLRPQNNTVWNEFVPLFAEMIVRQCANLVDKEISEGGIDGRMIKEHFGVEE